MLFSHIPLYFLMLHLFPPSPEFPSTVSRVSLYCAPCSLLLCPVFPSTVPRVPFYVPRVPLYWVLFPLYWAPCSPLLYPVFPSAVSCVLLYCAVFLSTVPRVPINCAPCSPILCLVFLSTVPRVSLYSCPVFLSCRQTATHIFPGIAYASQKHVRGNTSKHALRFSKSGMML